MSQNELKVNSRNETGKGAAKRLRREGMVPAVAYGHKEEPVKLAVNARELRDLVAHHGSHGLLMLKYETGGPQDLPVIIKALQRHPVRHSVNSVDFLRVSLNEEVTASIPLIVEGEPEAVRMGDGILVQALHELQVSAFPQNLPEQITVDVSHLELNGAPIHVKEITLPTGVTAVTDGEEAIAVVNLPRLEEPEVTGEETAEDEAADGETAAEGETATAA